MTAGRRVMHPMLARVAGFLLDLVLLCFFLLLGMAVLDILVQTIVLVVGYASEPRADLVARKLVKWDPNRHRDDWMHLGLAILETAGSALVFAGALRLRRWALQRFVDARFESFVSKRYLLSREGGGLVNLIAVVSVLGVAVGVMALIVVISVMNGFDRELVEKMIGVFAHVEVWPVSTPEGEFSDAEAAKIMAWVEKDPRVVGAAPLLSRQTFFQPKAGTTTRREGALLRGIDVDREAKVSVLGRKDIIISGTGRPGERQIVLGSELARKLEVRVGDTVYALGEVIATARGTTPKILPLTIVGIFRSGLYDVDSNFSYCTIKTVQNLSLADGKVSAVHLRVKDPTTVEYVQDDFVRTMPRGYFLRNWKEINPEFFKALRTEKIAMFIILLLVILVAALNIIGTLIMTVTQKTREIGILKSMGATRASIMGIFLYHGFLVGLVGTGLGTAWGLQLCHFVEYDIEKIFQLPGAVYGLERLPVVVETQPLVFMVCCSLVICIVASVIPAIQASRLNPVEALRHE